MLQKLKEQQGEFLLTGAFRLLIGCAALAFGISIFTVMYQANKLTVMANDVTRHIEILGQTGPTVNQTFAELKEASNLEDASVAVNASFSAGGNRIQFGDPFTVTVSYTGKIGIGGMLSLPVPLRSSVVGRSEQYWK